MPTTTTATARQALADARDQAELIASQLAAVTEAIATAEASYSDLTPARIQELLARLGWE